VSTSPERAITVNSILDLVGGTPLVRLNRVVPHDAAAVWAKVEFFNPGGSIKDRISLAMIEAAEHAGELTPGATIVEATSGNTGIGLALVAAVKGYRLILTMPETMSKERRRLLAAYGAEVVLTPGDEGMSGAVRRAAQLAEGNPGCFMPHQFENPSNPEAHRGTTAQEILAQVDGRLDAFVAGVGTGGTITGVGEVLRELCPDVLVIAVEPASSAVLSGDSAGSHKIEGLGAGFVPAILNRAVLDQVIPVSDSAAMAMARRLGREEGILVGVSSGAAACAAVEVATQLGAGKTVVVVLPDTGGRYLSTELFQGIPREGRTGED